MLSRSISTSSSSSSTSSSVDSTMKTCALALAHTKQPDQIAIITHSLYQLGMSYEGIKEFFRARGYHVCSVVQSTLDMKDERIFSTEMAKSINVDKRRIQALKCQEESVHMTCTKKTFDLTQAREFLRLSSEEQSESSAAKSSSARTFYSTLIDLLQAQTGAITAQDGQLTNQPTTTALEYTTALETQFLMQTALFTSPQEMHNKLLRKGKDQAAVNTPLQFSINGRVVIPFDATVVASATPSMSTPSDMPLTPSRSSYSLEEDTEVVIVPPPTTGRTRNAKRKIEAALTQQQKKREEQAYNKRILVELPLLADTNSYEIPSGNENDSTSFLNMLLELPQEAASPFLMTSASELQFTHAMETESEIMMDSTQSPFAPLSYLHNPSLE